MKTKEEGLEERAKLILGLVEKAEIEPEKIKYVFRQRVKKYHPDVSKENPEKFQLILQAYNYLKFKKANETHLLENNRLVEEFLGQPVEVLGKSYDQWLIEHFYGSDGSIWPDRSRNRKSKKL